MRKEVRELRMERDFLKNFGVLREPKEMRFAAIELRGLAGRKGLRMDPAIRFRVQAYHQPGSSFVHRPARDDAGRMAQASRTPCDGGGWCRALQAAWS